MEKPATEIHRQSTQEVVVLAFRRLNRFARSHTTLVAHFLPCQGAAEQPLRPGISRLP